jgi:WD40 repeat protein
VPRYTLVTCSDPPAGYDARRRFTAGRGELQALAFSADGKLAAAAGRDENQAIAVWNVETGQQVARLTGHEQYVTCLLFLPDARRLISARLLSPRSSRQVAS